MMKASIKKGSALLIVIATLVLLNYAIAINRDWFIQLETYGYIGIFVSCLMLNATVLLPSSSTAVVMSMATVYNPFLVAVSGAVGSTIGEFTGYFAGYYGSDSVGKSALFSKIINLYSKWPDFTIAIFAFLPLPVFDVLGILAGSTKMSKKKFFALCLVGKTLKMVFYAFLGVYVHDKMIQLHI